MPVYREYHLRDAVLYHAYYTTTKVRDARAIWWRCDQPRRGRGVQKEPAVARGELVVP